jgi:hypothetical protein
VNEAAGGLRWMPDGRYLVGLLVPDQRGAAPKPPRAPTGPVIMESAGRRAPIRTHQDLLGNEYDEALFEHYFTSLPALIDTTSEMDARACRILGEPAVYTRLSPSPDGQYLLVERLRPPWSYMVRMSNFAATTAVWDIHGTIIHRLADLPVADAIPIRGVRTGPRSAHWRPLHPATLVWVEALDGGDPKTETEHRDRLMKLAAPFDDEPRQFALTGAIVVWRY